MKANNKLTHRSGLRYLALGFMAFAVCAFSASAATAPGIVLSDTAGNSVTIDFNNNVTCTGSCSTTSLVYPPTGIIDWKGTIGAFSLEAIGLASPNANYLGAVDLGLNALSTTGTGGTLTAKFSQTGISADPPFILVETTSLAAGTESAVFTGYADSTNTAFGTGSLIGSITDNGFNQVSAGPYSTSESLTVTEVVTVGANTVVDIDFGLYGTPPSNSGGNSSPPSLGLACPPATGEVGVVYNSAVVVANGVGPYTFAVTAGALPPGLTLNTTTGTITGKPTAAGAYGFTIQVTDKGASNATATSTCASTCSGANVVWNLASNPGFLGNSQTYTSGAIPIVAYGYSTSSSPMMLYGTIGSGDDYGLGVYGASHNEIDSSHFVQFDISKLNAANPSAVTITVTDVQSGESYNIYGSNTPGSLGTPLFSTNQTTDATPITLTGISGYKYISVHAISGLVLVANISATVGTCTVTIVPAIDLDCGSCTAGNATVGSSYTSTLKVTNGAAPFTFALASGSSLPPGLTLDPSAGIISGTPTTAGTYTYTAVVTDNNGATDTATCLIKVEGPPPIDLECGTCGYNSNATVGTSYTAKLTVFNGKTPYTFTYTGTIPPGLSLDTTGGIISGTPTKAGTYTITTKVVDATGATDTATCTIQVFAVPLDIECGTCGASNTTVGASYSVTLSTTGGTAPYTYKVIQNSLPPGLILSGNQITGKPTTAGIFTVTIQVTDSNGNTDQTTCTIHVTGASLDLECGTCGSTVKASVGSSYTAQLAVTGGSGSYTFAVVSQSSGFGGWGQSSSPLPPGLSLNSSTGVITGTPTQAGTYTFTSQVTDNKSKATDTANCTITVASSIVTLNCGPCGAGKATAGSPYSAQLSVTGGSGPYTYSISQGSLPAGLTLSSTGLISGKPGAVGTFNVTFQVTDSQHHTDTATCSIVVIGVPLTLNCGSCSLASATLGVAYTANDIASGGSGKLTYSIVNQYGGWGQSGSSLPPGLSLSSSTGVITGTPTTAGTYSFQLQVSDTSGDTATATCTIKVESPPVNLGPGTCGATKGKVGSGYSSQLNATGGSGRYSYSVGSGSLPPGMSLDGGAGKVYGTPSKAGTYVFTAKVTDSNGSSDTTTCILTVDNY